MKSRNKKSAGAQARTKSGYRRAFAAAPVRGRTKRSRLALFWDWSKSVKWQALKANWESWQGWWR